MFVLNKLDHSLCFISIADISTVRNLELISNMSDQKSPHSLFGALNHTKTPQGGDKSSCLSMQYSLTAYSLKDTVDSLKNTLVPTRNFSQFKVYFSFCMATHTVADCVYMYT